MIRTLLFRLLLISIAPLAVSSCSRTVERIKEHGIANVVTVPHAGPLIYQNQGELVGLDAELAKRIVDRLNRAEIGPDQPTPVRLRWIGKSYRTWREALRNREADLAVAVLGITEQAPQHVQFSDPYYTSELVLLVNPIYRRDLRGSKDLKGATIGVRDFTAVREFVEKQFPDSTTEPFKVLDDAVLALRRGEVDAVIEDRNMAAHSLATVPGFRYLEILPGSVGKIDCGVALRERDHDFLQLINEVIADAKEQDKIAQWISQHIGPDQLAEVEGRHLLRLEMVDKPRRIAIRVSKDADFSFDIYRLANLRFIVANQETGESYRSSPIGFQRRIGVSRAKLLPGRYTLSLPKYKLRVAFTIEIQDSSDLILNIRLRRGTVDVEKRQAGQSGKH